jgi:hypothetical protein
MNQFPPHPRVIRLDRFEIFFENSRRYSRVKVHHLCQRIINEKRHLKPALYFYAIQEVLNYQRGVSINNAWQIPTTFLSIRIKH